VTVPVMGVTKTHETEGAVTVKYALPVLMANVEVPEEVQKEPFVHERLMAGVPAVRDVVACKDPEQIDIANSTGKIQRKRSLFITLSFHPLIDRCGRMMPHRREPVRYEPICQNMY
jgi:hypothetical protein